MKTANIFKIGSVLVVSIALIGAPQASAQRGGRMGGGFHGGGFGGFHGGGGFHAGSGFHGGSFGGSHGGNFGGFRGGSFGGFHGGFGGFHGGYHGAHFVGFPGWGWGLSVGFGPYWGYPYYWGYASWWGPYAYGYPYPPNYYSDPYYDDGYGDNNPDRARRDIPDYRHPDDRSAPPANVPRPEHQNAPTRPSSAPAMQGPQSYVSTTFADFRMAQFPKMRPAVRNVIAALRAMPPDARRRQLDFSRYRNFSQGERELLVKATEIDQAEVVH